MPFSTFQKIVPLLTSASTIILNGIGEPLMNPDLDQMIAFSSDTMSPGSTIGFQSNGLLLDNQRVTKLLDAGLTEICISLDSLDPLLSSGELHGGQDLGLLERCFSALASSKNRRVGGCFRFGVEIVLMRDNLFELPTLISWAIKRGADFGIVTHLLPYENSSENQSLFNPNTSTATAIFQKWNQIACEAGIDLGQYYLQMWKRGRPDNNSTAFKILEAMQGEARDREVWLNLNSLLEHQEKNTLELTKIFKDTDAIAAQHGFDLFLPPPYATDQHQCRFIDEKAVFITPAGLVAPCHSLWHNTFSCLTGEKLHVRARYFGSILEEHPLAIWNKPEYREFRQEAENSTFPTCRSCALGPCPDITANNYVFETDCHGNSTLCGSCLWSQGGIRCL